MAWGIAGYIWTLGPAKYVTMEKLWTRGKLDGADTDRDFYSGADRCLDF